MTEMKKNLTRTRRLALTGAFAALVIVLGITKLPNRFVRVITDILEQQIENPTNGFIPPTEDQKTEALLSLQEFRERQENFNQEEAQKIKDKLSSGMF